MDDLPNTLLVIPGLTLVFGFSGLVALYGINWGSKEIPTTEIQWNEITVKKMNGIKNLRLNEVIDFFDGGYEGDDTLNADYEMKSESLKASLIAGPSPNKASFIKRQMMHRKSDLGLKALLMDGDGQEDLYQDVKFIQTNFENKQVEVQLLKEKGQIIITYLKGSRSGITLWHVVFSKQMVYLFLRYSVLT